MPEPVLVMPLLEPLTMPESVRVALLVTNRLSARVKGTEMVSDADALFVCTRFALLPLLLNVKPAPPLASSV